MDHLGLVGPVDLFRQRVGDGFERVAQSCRSTGLQRPMRSLVADGRSVRLATQRALQTEPTHARLDRTARDASVVAAPLPPDVLHAAELKVIRLDAPARHARLVVPTRVRRALIRLARRESMTAVHRRSDRQHPADRLDCVDRAVIVDKRLIRATIGAFEKDGVIQCR